MSPHLVTKTTNYHAELVFPQRWWLKPGMVIIIITTTIITIMSFITR